MEPISPSPSEVRCACASRAQLGYTNIKYLTHLTLTDNLKTFGKGLG